EATGIDQTVFRPHDTAIEKNVSIVRPNHEKIRSRFGKDAGKIIALLAKKDLGQLVKDRTHGETIKVENFEIPLDFLDTKEETVKETGTRFLPHVIEPSFGVERLVYSTLEHNLGMREDRLVLGLPFRLAPVQASVYPLVNKDGLVERANRIFEDLSSSGIRVEFDDAGSIGRRYARADEAGIPIGITIDYDTLKDDTVTLRDRDSWSQIRVKADELKGTIHTIVNKGFPKTQDSHRN
ncbi:MAG TPA: His/Gly/Thr/Pro-type tRNA ligase C-terminal domain-containing protein, partial [Candidatus Bathyarchaeia archaeon]|nr:His/Gly/Thr/Pro-type tRNA ligase C-terminal domain-containing protein [Candidatus Bathyarchaeia archaeon]